MNEGRKTNVTQILLLVGLLGALAFMVFRVMLPQMNANKEREERRAARRASSAGAEDTAAGNGVTKMPVVPTTSGSGSQKAIARAESEYRLNPNQFRVFNIDPPKNPFGQNEAWYADTLKELPGYPQLRDSGYLDSSAPYLPPVPEVLDPSRQWSRVVIQRDKSSSNMEISGASADGSLNTTVSLSEGTAGEDRVEWTPEIGIPLSALTVPGWDQQYPEQAAMMRGLIPKPSDAAVKDNSKAPGGLDRSSDLFIGDSYTGLQVPGDGSPGDALGDGQSHGDSIACTGINRQGKRASAIMVLNGKSYIVSEGSVLPTHYQVLEIKGDGVVITDLKDGSSRWVEVSSAQREGRNGSKKKNNDEPAKPADDAEEQPETVIAPADLPVFVR